MADIKLNVRGICKGDAIGFVWRRVFKSFCKQACLAFNTSPFFLHKSGYRADIDGLRAIAILSVVLFHAGLGFPGGYVGVDVFFVISGYLITALILKDLERGSFYMANFWERRIRRIFPALAAMVAVTCLAGWFLLLPEDLANLGASVIAQSLLVSNFYFWRTTNYFGGANEEKPLLHTWSLAVEEQFYLIFPIALMAFWWAWSRWQKAQADGILGTTNHINLHENLTTDDTDEHGWGNRKAAPGEPGLALSSQNPSTSELARACENTSLARSASIPAGALRAGEMGSSGENQLANSAKGAKALDPRPSTLDASSIATSPDGDSRRWALFWLFAGVALLSLGISVWGVKAQPFATFFLLPTRAWELLLGSMMAVLPTSVFVRSGAMREILCLAGLIGIFLPVFYYDKQTPFPGLAALPPCLGTAALIWANTPLACAGRTFFATLLSLRPVVFIGLISYSLYLWHWPVFVFLEYWKTSYILPVTIKISGIAVSIIFAVLSWKFVENPIRRYQGFVSRKTIFVVCASATTIFAALGWLQVWKDGFPSRLSDAGVNYLTQIEKNIEIRENYESKFSELYLANSLVFGSPENPILLGENTQKPAFLLFGDSYARHLAPVFDKIARNNGIAGAMVSHTATPPLDRWKHVFPFTVSKPDDHFNKVMDFVANHQIKTIYLAAFWSYYEKEVGSGVLLEALQSTVRNMKRIGIEPIVLMGHPCYGVDIPKQEVKAKLVSSPEFYLQEFRQEISDHYKKNTAIYLFKDQFADVPCLDPALKFVDPNSHILMTSFQGNPLYSDASHLNYHGVEYAWEDLLNGFFNKILMNVFHEKIKK